MKLWGGRFQHAPAAAFERFSESFAFDRRLAAAEVEGSRAHARGLARAGVLTAAEAAALAAAFDQLAAEFEAGPPALEEGLEDVHT
ncbi:MAG TPA: lyase family protein, partial [Terriglobales bacterium]|nr:lyase family protein [Terriglobales bacterium]